MPNEVFDDGEFQFELADFLSRANAVDSDSPLPPPAHQQYINALLNGVLQSVGCAADVTRVTKHTAPSTSTFKLRGVGCPADVSRIIKRVRDHVARSRSFLSDVDVWRRSPLWLLIRVAVQTTVNRSLGRALYKQFILFFMCTLARDEGNASLSSDLLHLMSSRILRRLSKLGSSTPDWLSEMALKTNTCLREILDSRWEQLNTRPSPFRNPSHDDVTRDTQLLLLHSGEYIRNALTNPGPQLLGTPFRPSHPRRGTIEDFLSSNGTFFEEAYHAEPNVTLYDVEQSVERGIDDWIACVTNVDEACAQLEILMDKYMEKAYEQRVANPEDQSIGLLTAIELYVALDKLVVKEIPMLADYPPEIPIPLLEGLLIRKTASLHRLSCAYQYLSARHSQSRSGWSVLSNEFTEDSFAVRYYDQSSHLQQLKARIEQDTMERGAGHAGQQLEGASLAQTYDGYQEYQRHLPVRRLVECAQSPLPALLLHAKVVVFELQCPACIRIWRSAMPRILHYFRRYGSNPLSLVAEEGHHLLAHVPALQPYFVERQGSPLRHQICFAYFYSEIFQSRHSPTLRYVVQNTHPKTLELTIWQPGRHYSDHELSFNLTYGSGVSFSHECPLDRNLEKYMDYTSHTPNDVLATQADCPADLSLDEFIAFGHLRSGGSLQWLNILQGLRSRTLNLRRHQVHLLLAHATFQVGPLDLNTGAWTWHRELQESSFCNDLLDELDSLFVDVGAGLMDGMLMNTISMLLSRVIASSPSEGVSDRTIALLRTVRMKTFSWVQEVSYDLTQAPMNEERRTLLLCMAATCRSTFDVDPTTLRKLFQSPEDVDALLSCAFFIHALRSTCMSKFLDVKSSEHSYFNSSDISDKYSRLLLERDRRLSLTLEEILRDVILADVSDYGVDLAVGKIFVTYQPGTQRWEQLQHPNACWLTCNTEATVEQPSQTVHIYLLNGALLVNGQLLGGLPREIGEVFPDVCTCSSF
jgi:hypothetical protein